MTSPFFAGRPARPEDLSTFYPEWSAPASGIEAEKRMCLDRSTQLAREKRQRDRAALVRRIADAWVSLWERTRLRRPVIGRVSADDGPAAVERFGKPPVDHAVKGL